MERRECILKLYMALADEGEGGRNGGTNTLGKELNVHLLAEET